MNGEDPAGYDLLLEDMDAIAKELQKLRDAGVPVLWRPLHEASGGWFWWGSATTDRETYNALFRYTKNYLTSKGVHNFIYVYSPGGPIASEAEYLDRYPARKLPPPTSTNDRISRILIASLAILFTSP